MTELTIGALIASQPKRFCQNCGKSLAGQQEQRKRCKECAVIHDREYHRKLAEAYKPITRERQRLAWREMAKDPAFREKEKLRLRALRAKKKLKAPAE